jgi:hypothetical protein
MKQDDKHPEEEIKVTQTQSKEEIVIESPSKDK